MILSQPVPPDTPLTPIVVQIADTRPTEIGVIDILLGSLGITGLLLVGSALLGLAVAAVIFWMRRRFEEESEGASLGTAQLKLTPPPARETSPPPARSAP